MKFWAVRIQDQYRLSLVAMIEAVNENERYFFKGKAEGLRQVLEAHFGSEYVNEVNESLNL